MTHYTSLFSEWPHWVASLSSIAPQIAPPAPPSNRPLHLYHSIPDSPTIPYFLEDDQTHALTIAGIDNIIYATIATSYTSPNPPPPPHPPTSSTTPPPDAGDKRGSSAVDPLPLSDPLPSASSSPNKPVSKRSRKKKSKSQTAHANSRPTMLQSQSRSRSISPVPDSSPLPDPLVQEAISSFHPSSPHASSSTDPPQ